DAISVLLKNAPNLSILNIHNLDYGGTVYSLIKNINNQTYNESYVNINHMIKTLKYNLLTEILDGKEKQTLLKIFSNIEYFDYTYRCRNTYEDEDDFLSNILNTITKLILLNKEIYFQVSEIDKIQYKSSENILHSFVLNYKKNVYFSSSYAEKYVRFNVWF
ncbi:unnamed protein product, partial [Adineta steineri]